MRRAHDERRSSVRVGVYAVAEATGTIRQDDQVSLV
jgi:hypothetical protein